MNEELLLNLREPDFPCMSAWRVILLEVQEWKSMILVRGSARATVCRTEAGQSTQTLASLGNNVWGGIH